MMMTKRMSSRIKTMATVRMRMRMMMMRRRKRITGVARKRPTGRATLLTLRLDRILKTQRMRRPLLWSCIVPS